MKYIEKILHIIANIPHDKFLHLFAGYVISHVINNLYDGIFTPSYWGAIIGFIVALIIGVLKEIYNYKYRENETPEVGDIIYTASGGFASSIVSLILLL